MALRKTAFAATLRRFARVGLDSSILIYHLEDSRPYSELTEVLFTSIGENSLAGICSTISVTELLAKPFREKRMDVIDAFERFIHSFPNLRLSAPTYYIARDAASLRGKYNLRTPDALLLATARLEKANGFLTNDSSLRKVREPGISVTVLDDYI
jgi:predicted nucleic acid-binding protein